MLQAADNAFQIEPIPEVNPDEVEDSDTENLNERDQFHAYLVKYGHLKHSEQ